MTKKYRPYLSLPMMERIVLCVEHTIGDGAGDPNIDNEIIASLQVMILKARHEITKPSYVPISGRIGMDVPINEQTGPSYRYNAGLMSEKEREEYEAELMNEIIASKKQEE
jgi:hypothetical protein